MIKIVFVPSSVKTLGASDIGENISSLSTNIPLSFNLLAISSGGILELFVAILNGI